MQSRETWYLVKVFFLDVVRLGLGVVTAADVAKRAAVEVLEVFDEKLAVTDVTPGNFVNTTLSIGYRSFRRLRPSSTRCARTINLPFREGT